MRLINIVVHHTGGAAADPLASTINQTWQNINAYHKARWNFESRFIKGMYGGYNVIYDPKDRTFHQFRAIGEETAAQYGHNRDSFSLCVIGNYSKMSDHESVDPMTAQIEDDIGKFLSDLINGNRRELVTAPDVVMDFSTDRIYPHRHFASTACNGNFLPDTWARDLAIKHRPLPQSYSEFSSPLIRPVPVQMYLKARALLAGLFSKKGYDHYPAHTDHAGGKIVERVGECQIEEIKN